jgi:glycosyltransferase involved in cell wall biosynthesis
VRLNGANIICLSSIDWAFNWQLPQEVASALGAANRVLFVENTGVRRPKLRDLGRLRGRLKNWARSRGGTTATAAGVDIHAPLLLPLPYSRAARALNTFVLLRTVRRWLRVNRDTPLIVITFLPTPLALSLIRAVKPRLAVYYCADYLSESSPGARKLVPYEREMLAVADLVLVTSEGLQSHAKKVAARVELLPSGVRFDDFDRARQSAERPPALDGIEGPVVGFVGSVRDQIDLPLLAAVTELLPEMTFVLAGPLLTDASRLAARPNVRILGPVSHADVIRTVAHFDAGIVPYVMSSFTRHIMPLKLKEYLAAGLPVVATSLPAVVSFAADHPGVIAFANDAQAFAAALRTAVKDHHPDAIVRRREVARRYDWSTQMASMITLIEEMLAAR